MANERYTILVEPCLTDRVTQTYKKRYNTLSEFYTTAILNQLEKDGDFDIRDEYQEVLERAEEN